MQSKRRLVFAYTQRAFGGGPLLCALHAYAERERRGKGESKKKWKSRARARAAVKTEFQNIVFSPKLNF